MFKLTAIAGLLFATAIFATIPVSPQVTPRGLELSVDQAQAVIMAAPVELPAGSSGVTIATPGEPSAGARSTTALRIGGAGANEESGWRCRCWSLVAGSYRHDRRS